jgi:tetratricopeptide (TPR) repeat protein
VEDGILPPKDGNTPVENGGREILKRAALLRPTDNGVATVVALVSLASEGGSLSLMLSPPSGRAPESVGSLKGTIQAIAASLGPFRSEPEKLWDAALDALRKHGWAIEERPVADFSLALEFDGRSGRLVGQQRALHEAARPANDVAARIAEALAELLAGWPAEVAQAVSEAVAAGDHAGAAKSALSAEASAKLWLGDPTTVLVALRTVDPTKVGESERRAFLELRCAVASLGKDYQAAADDAEVVLRDYKDALSPDRGAGLEMSIALGEIHSGKKTAAYLRLREIECKVANLGPRRRGWLFRNLALLLESNAPDESCLYAQRSRDSFLEAGDRREAARSMVGLANRLLHRSPKDALKPLDEALSWLPQDTAGDRDARASLLAIRAHIRLRLNDASAAVRDARDAVTALTGLVHVEPDLASAYRLLAHAAERAGEASEAAAALAQARQIETSAPDRLRTIKLHLLELLTQFDGKALSELKAEISSSGDARFVDMRPSLAVVEALNSPELSYPQKVGLIESALAKITGVGARDHEDRALLNGALGLILLKNGDEAQALNAFEAALRDDPLAHDARQNIAALLMKLRRWEDSSHFFEAQMRMWGRQPGILYGLARAVLEMGDFDRATNLFHEAYRALGPDNSLRVHCERFREMAMSRGGRLLAVEPPILDVPVTFDELRGIVREFATFVKTQQRMSFWTGGSGRRGWRKNPEAHAQDLFLTFLKGRLGNRVEEYEELPNVGAGRIDVYLVLAGGMRVVVELKMLGHGYSSGYAFSGIDQITHYMDNKGTALGILLVLDSRARTWGAVPTPPPDRTIVIELVDVRPVVKPKL